MFFFLKIFLITVFLGGIGFFVFSSGIPSIPTVDLASLLPAAEETEEEEEKVVKGAETKRAEKINEQIVKDLGKNAEVVKEDILDTKISDILGAIMRLQKVPQDIEVGKEFVTDQVNGVLETTK
ncbi:MAG: hypothetical protein AAB553_02010 [Patescibacteria group bacterium]